MDWPLSREEKKSLLIQLYDQDVEIADQLLRDYAQRLQAGPGSSVVKEPQPPSEQPEKETFTGEAVESLRMVVANAAASAFVGFLGAWLGSGPAECEDCDKSELGRQRARSEGSRKVEPRPALRQTPRKRLSRGGLPLRVSFADSDRRPGDSDSDPAEPEEPEPQPEPAEPRTEIVATTVATTWMELREKTEAEDDFSHLLLSQNISRGRAERGRGRSPMGRGNEEEPDEMEGEGAPPRRREARRARLQNRLHGYAG